MCDNNNAVDSQYVDVREESQITSVHPNFGSCITTSPSSMIIWFTIVNWGNLKFSWKYAQSANMRLVYGNVYVWLIQFLNAFLMIMFIGVKYHFLSCHLKQPLYVLSGLSHYQLHMCVMSVSFCYIAVLMWYGGLLVPY